MTPPLSLVVVAYNIERELPRTLQSLSVGYQRGVNASDYEVVVVDNGSPTPVDPSVFDGLDGQFRLVRIDDASPSPAPAVNRGLREARGDAIGVLVDGARLVTPGFVHYALVGSRVHPRSAVVSLGWYLGFDFQRYALDAGWTKADEDALLESIDWPADGYRLFEISSLDESSVEGWFLGVFESNGLFLPASVWTELGGFDERFASPGGGLVNHDTLQRAADRDDLGWVILLGEGTFHQIHGGIATNVSAGAIDEKMQRWRAEYEAISGRTLYEHPPLPDPIYLGPLPEVLWPRFGYSVSTMLHATKRLPPPVIPPVPLPDPETDSNEFAAQWSARAGAAARQGRATEAQHFARLARAADPSARDVTPLLSCIATHRPLEQLSRPERAQFFLDNGLACEGAGAVADAEAHFREALTNEPRLAAAYEGLSRLRMPGPGYYDRISRIHEQLNPASYLEIGVFTGESLALARPPTVAIGVDPDPQIRELISVELHLYRETSTQFFQRDLRSVFGGGAPSLVFIDGLHEFPAVLEDFANVEAVSDPGTIVLLHDMIPFDETTQQAERVHEFYTGDVWKLLHCLADVRPDLSWFTIRTPPSGLTVVGGLDSTSTVLRDEYEKLVERFASLTFDDALNVPGPVLENEWSVAADNLRRLREANAPVDSAHAVGPAGSMVEARDAEQLARRIRDLETVDAARRKELAALKRARREASLGVVLDPESAQAQLELMRNTKLFRWTRPLRALYSRLRGRGRGSE
ncbi:MAG: class I SAM-dependent methyltransferase [Acidimicrobiia bacterium]